MVSSEGLCVCLSLLHLPSSFPSCSRGAAASRWLSTLGVLSSNGGGSNRGRRKRLRRLFGVLPGSLHCSAEGTASALRPSSAGARGAPLPESGPRGRGAGSRKVSAPPLRAPDAAGPSRAPPPRFYPRAARVGCGAGRRVPPLRVLPPAGTSSELREGAGWARGVGHAEREGGGGAANRSSGRRPPRCLAATVPLLPPALHGSRRGGARARRRDTGVHTGDRGWRPSGEYALIHSGQLIASVCAVLNRVVVGCWEGRGDTSSPGGRGATGDDPT